MAPDGATERHRPEALSESEKAAAAAAAAALLRDGMRVGLGTGSTVAHLLPAVAARGLRELRCVATSPATENAAVELGLEVVPLEVLKMHAVDVPESPDDILGHATTRFPESWRNAHRSSANHFPSTD